MILLKLCMRVHACIRVRIKHQWDVECSLTQPTQYFFLLSLTPTPTLPPLTRPHTHAHTQLHSTSHAHTLCEQLRCTIHNWKTPCPLPLASFWICGLKRGRGGPLIISATAALPTEDSAEVLKS